MEGPTDYTPEVPSPFPLQNTSNEEQSEHSQKFFSEELTVLEIEAHLSSTHAQKYLSFLKEHIFFIKKLQSGTDLQKCQAMSITGVYVDIIGKLREKQDFHTYKRFLKEREVFNTLGKYFPKDFLEECFMESPYTKK